MATGTVRVGGGSRLPRVLRALVSLVILAAIGVGVPLVLLRWGYWPIHGLPSVDQVRDGWTRAVTDRAFFGVLTVAAWLVWALFILSTATEMWAEITQRRAARIPLAGPLQRSARYLVASLAMAIGAATAGGRGASPPALPTTFEAVQAPLLDAVGLDRSDQPPVRATTDSASSDEVGKVMPSGKGGVVGAGAGGSAERAPDRLPHKVVVQPHDTAWGIAEQLWGDGLRWTELWESNRDRPQPDGQRWTDPELIHPGWELVVPGTTPERSVGQPPSGPPRGGAEPTPEEAGGSESQSHPGRAFDLEIETTGTQVEATEGKRSSADDMPPPG